MMNRISPFAVGIAAVLIIGLIMQIPLDSILTEDTFTSFQIEYISLSIKMSLILLLAVLSVKKIGMPALSGLSPHFKWTSRGLNLIPVYLLLIGIATFIGKDLSNINISNLLLLFIACMAVGFAEEFMFRGFLQPLFIRRYISDKNGLFLGVLYPAIFFGASHLLNLTVNDNIPQVVVQSVYAVMIGFFFGVLLLKTNKLVPLAITHGLINFFFLITYLPGLNELSETQTANSAELSLSEQIISSAIPLLMFLPLFIAGLLILKRVNKEQLLMKINLDTGD